VINLSDALSKKKMEAQSRKRFALQTRHGIQFSQTEGGLDYGKSKFKTISGGTRAAGDWGLPGPL
jgi:hypothetical protein